MNFVLTIAAMIAAMILVAILLDDEPQPAGCLQVRTASVCR